MKPKKHGDQSFKLEDKASLILFKSSLRALKISININYRFFTYFIAAFLFPRISDDGFNTVFVRMVKEVAGKVENLGME